MLFRSIHTKSSVQSRAARFRAPSLALSLHSRKNLTYSEQRIIIPVPRVVNPLCPAIFFLFFTGEWLDLLHIWGTRYFASKKAKKTQTFGCKPLNWSGQRESNSRPSAPKADALPTALCPGRSLIKIALFPEKESLQ